MSLNQSQTAITGINDASSEVSSLKTKYEVMRPLLDRLSTVMGGPEWSSNVPILMAKALLDHYPELRDLCKRKVQTASTMKSIMSRKMFSKRRRNKKTSKFAGLKML